MYHTCLVPLGLALLTATALGMRDHVEEITIAMGHNKMIKMGGHASGTSEGEVSSSTSDRIWRGSDVELKDVDPDGGLKIGTFPAFVSLVWRKRKGPQTWSCGGTLYRKKYIITAAHCLDGLPRSDWVLHAHLNPYVNPKVVEAALLYSDVADYYILMHNKSIDRQSPAPSDFWHDYIFKHMPEVKAFRDNMTKHGLGIPLWIRQLWPEMTEYGIKHPKYAASGMSSYDIALIPVEVPHNEVPFVNFVYNEHFKVDLANTDTLDKIGTFYGNGAVAPEDAKCRYSGWQNNCRLQQKRLKVHSADECFESVAVMMAVLMRNRCKNLTANNPEDLKVCTQSQKAINLTLDTLDPAKRSEGIEILREHQSDFLPETVLKGRQLCVMSEARTGSLQDGDSGGPLVSEDGRLLAVAAWGHGTKNGNVLNITAEDTSVFFKNRSTAELLAHEVRLPTFFSSMSYFGPGIDKAISCMDKEPENGAECSEHLDVDK